MITVEAGFSPDVKDVEKYIFPPTHIMDIWKKSLSDSKFTPGELEHLFLMRKFKRKGIKGASSKACLHDTGKQIEKWWKQRPPKGDERDPGDVFWFSDYLRPRMFVDNPDITQNVPLARPEISWKQFKSGKRSRKFKKKNFIALIDSIVRDDPYFREVDLRGWGLDGSALRVLSEALCLNTHVTALDVSDNPSLWKSDKKSSKHSGAEFYAHAFSNMLSVNRSITHVNLERTGMSIDHARVILFAFFYNRTVKKIMVKEDNKGVALAGSLLEASLPLHVLEAFKKAEQENIRYHKYLQKGVLYERSRWRVAIDVHFIHKLIPNLVCLNLTDNAITFIPREITLLKNLRWLLLTDNFIDTIPDNIHELTRLQELILGYNAIKSIPTSLCKLRGLIKLDLNHNQVERLPRRALGMMKSLLYLNISYNPLAERLPKSIVNRSGEATMNWIREIFRGTETVHRMKLMFVGNGGVGKSSLLANFKKDEAKSSVAQFELLNSHSDEASSILSGMTSEITKLAKSSGSKKEPAWLRNVATDGIDIAPINVKCGGDGELLTFSAWDFAGQEVYYATHGFFMSNRAVYLLVFSLLQSEEHGRIEYWLQSIQCRANSAPVILVGTHVDAKELSSEDVSSFFSRLDKRFSKRFPFVKGCIAVSNTTKRGLDSLLRTISTVALKHGKENGYIPQEIPRTYLVFEQAVIAERDKFKEGQMPVLSLKKMRKIAVQECNIDPRGIDDAIRFLDEIGTVLHFRNEDALRHVVIVDPQWIVKVFATLVNTQNTSFTRDGILQLKDLPFVWKEYSPDMYTTLLALLERFEVILKLRSDQWKKSSSGELPTRANRVGGAAASGGGMASAAEGSSGRKTVCRSILIPSLMTKELGDERVHGVWPVGFREDEVVAAREFAMPFLPLGFFSKLVVRILSASEFSPLLLGADQIYFGLSGLKEEDAVVLRLSVDHRPPSSSSSATTTTTTGSPVVQRRQDDDKPWKLGIAMRARKARHAARILATLTEGVKVLVTQWLRIPFRIDVLCHRHLLAGLPRPHRFDYNVLDAMSVDGRMGVSCPVDGVQVDLARMVPDLCMADVPAVGEEQLDLERVLATGSMGVTIWKGVLKVTGEEVAVKKFGVEQRPMVESSGGLDHHSASDVKEMEENPFVELRREILLGSLIRHPNVMRVLALCRNPFCVITELMDLGDLYGWIHRADAEWSLPTITKLAYDIARGMAAMHAHNVMHRDLKSPNVLLKRVHGVEGTTLLVAKVADLGLSSSLIFTSELSRKDVENPTWLAPEVIRELPYTKKSDVYAFGVMLWEMVARQDFLSDNEEYRFMSVLEQAIVDGKRPAIPEETRNFRGGALARMIEACWADSPGARPHFYKLAKELKGLLDESMLCAIKAAEEEEARVARARAHQRSVASNKHAAKLASASSSASPCALGDVRGEHRMGGEAGAGAGGQRAGPSSANNGSPARGPLHMGRSQSTKRLTSIPSSTTRRSMTHRHLDDRGGAGGRAAEHAATDEGDRDGGGELEGGASKSVWTRPSVPPRRSSMPARHLSAEYLDSLHRVCQEDPPRAQPSQRHHPRQEGGEGGG